MEESINLFWMAVPSEKKASSDMFDIIAPTKTGVNYAVVNFVQLEIAERIVKLHNTELEELLTKYENFIESAARSAPAPLCE